MDRERNVSGNLPSPAIAFGQNVTKSRATISVPWPTHTVALPAILGWLLIAGGACALAFAVLSKKR